MTTKYLHSYSSTIYDFNVRLTEEFMNTRDVLCQLHGLSMQDGTVENRAILGLNAICSMHPMRMEKTFCRW